MEKAWAMGPPRLQGMLAPRQEKLTGGGQAQLQKMEALDHSPCQASPARGNGGTILVHVFLLL